MLMPQGWLSKGALEDKFCYKLHVETCGFVVSWFHSIYHRELNETTKPVNTVSWFHYLSPMVILHLSYLISLNDGVDETLISQNHGFVVSWFRPLPSLKMTVGFVVSRFHGFAYSVFGSPI